MPHQARFVANWADWLSTLSEDDKSHLCFDLESDDSSQNFCVKGTHGNKASEDNCVEEITIKVAIKGILLGIMVVE